MSDAQPTRKKPLTAKQAQVMRVVRAGGCLVPNDLRKKRYRVLDAARNPIVTIQYRTFSALNQSERIVQNEDGAWIRKPLKSKKNATKKV
jgi:hypothetical protein